MATLLIHSRHRPLASAIGGIPTIPHMTQRPY